MKTIILVVMLFTYDGEGDFKSKTHHEFVQDSWADCEIVKKATLKTYYDHKSTAQKTGIFVMCRTKEVSPDGQAAPEGSKRTL